MTVVFKAKLKIGKLNWREIELEAKIGKLSYREIKVFYSIEYN
jgi:hypothetical protein